MEGNDRGLICYGLPFRHLTGRAEENHDITLSPPHRVCFPAILAQCHQLSIHVTTTVTTVPLTKYFRMSVCLYAQLSAITVCFRGRAEVNAGLLRSMFPFARWFYPYPSNGSSSGFPAIWIFHTHTGLPTTLTPFPSSLQKSIFVVVVVVVGTFPCRYRK